MINERLPISLLLHCVHYIAISVHNTNHGPTCQAEHTRQPSISSPLAKAGLPSWPTKLSRTPSRPNIQVVNPVTQTSFFFFLFNLLTCRTALLVTLCDWPIDPLDCLPCRMWTIIQQWYQQDPCCWRNQTCPVSVFYQQAYLEIP